MNQRNEEGLFDVLEEILKAAKEPMDCVEIYNQHMRVRNLATSANRVSDYLGNMWRKGLLVRLPGPRGDGGNKSRWMYAWKGRGPKPKPTMDQAIEFDDRVHTLLHKNNLRVDDDGKRLVIDTPYLTITIDHKDE